MNLYIITTEETCNIYEIAFDETDSKFHLVNLEDDFVRWQPFDSEADIFKALDEFKKAKIITDYYPL